MRRLRMSVGALAALLVAVGVLAFASPANASTTVVPSVDSSTSYTYWKSAEVPQQCRDWHFTNGRSVWIDRYVNGELDGRVRATLCYTRLSTTWYNSRTTGGVWDRTGNGYNSTAMLEYEADYAPGKQQYREIGNANNGADYFTTERDRIKNLFIRLCKTTPDPNVVICSGRI